jgi:hypothetical protein
MPFALGWAQRFIRRLSVLGIVFIASGCVRITGAYIDPTLPAASAADVKPAAHPADVQLLVEFRANNTIRAEATTLVQRRMLEIGRNSGLFGKVSTDPADGGRRLLVMINDYAGERQGSPVATGLTLGLAGTNVMDRYHCDARYEVPGHDPVSFVYEHALITSIGVASAPPGLTSYPEGVAINMVFDQLGWSIMRDLAARRVTEE